MDESAEVEELGTVVDLGPEALLEPLLGFAQPLGVLEVVEMRQHAHHLRETVNLHQRDSFEQGF